MSVYARKCQECGHIQSAKPPAEYKGDSWTEVKCKKCKSAALDYGHDGYEKSPSGEIVRAFENKDDSEE